MSVYYTTPVDKRLANIPKLCKKAGQRLKCFDYYNAHNDNARPTCRHFDISPQTFYRWKERYNLQHLESLPFPAQACGGQASYSVELVKAVLELREQYPRWGKDKLVILLQHQGFDSSASMIGRVLRKLREQGLLREPIANHISARKRQRQCPYAVGKPKGYQAKEPGDIVEIDTMDARLLPGIILKHFTARDIVSRQDSLGAHTRATSHTAFSFIDTLRRRMPFPTKSIQVDGRSEFQDAFERECQRRGIKPFFLPACAPKLKGHLERAQRAHTEGFYEVTDSNFGVLN